MRTFAEFPNEARSVTAARHFVGRALEDAIPGEAREVVELMVSELATNSIGHAHAGFSVLVNVEGPVVTLEVTDGGPGRPTVRTPTIAEPSGRGLSIVEGMSDEWGVTYISGAKRVWANLRLLPTPVGLA